MTATVNANGELNIVTMSLIDMLPLVVQATKDGYVLNFEKNEGYPQVLGSMHLLTMFPQKGVQVSKLDFTEPLTKVDGRRKKTE